MSETTIPASTAPSPPRRREVAWEDPLPALAAAPGLTGLELIREVIAGRLPAPPIGALMNLGIVAADEGTVTFTCATDPSMLNPLGSLHGGVACTLLDSVIGCAVHTTLPAGVGYTSIDITVSYLRSPAIGSELTAIGRVTKPGRRVAFGEGEVRDADGRLIATATGSCLIIDGRA